MKKLLLTAVMAVFLTGSALAAPQNPDYFTDSRLTAYSYVEDSSSATVTLVTGVAGQTVTLYKYIVSTSTTDNFYLQCGSTQKSARIYLGANSGLDSTFYPLYIRCASGDSLNLVKGTAATPVGVSLWFMQR